MSEMEKGPTNSLRNSTQDVSVDKDLHTPEDGIVTQQKIEDDFPEGGARAWMVALGASVGLLATFGYSNAFGYVK